MSVEIQTPFSLYPNGGIVVTADPNLQIEQHITSLVTTQLGERVMLPNYGVDTTKYVFSPNDETISAVLINETTSAINTWEPNVLVEAINPVVNESDTGIANIQVEFSQGVTALLGQTYKATILVGGTVVGDPNS